MGFKHFKLILFGLSLLLTGFSGCVQEVPNSDDPQPFLRLLENQQFHSNILDLDINYIVFLPKEYKDTTNSFPVVYLLHGMGDNEKAWYEGGNITYYVDENSDETVPMIYVMPQGFNSYWVNNYYGDLPYMDVLVKEIVPLIDSRFRTMKDPQHRAVMGYSMGGYGALILTAMNPGVFRTGVALSMSYRTDKQYMDEPQADFDLQWGSVFGGIGASGTDRLTDYYKTYNPFYFFKKADDLSLNGQNYYFDCGDDEENLSEPNNALSNLLRDLNIKHEYRVRNGAHDWEYWHSALPEVLKYISCAVRNIPYSVSQTPMDSVVSVPAVSILKEQLEGSEIKFNLTLPETYSSDTISYPVILVLQDSNVSTQDQESQKICSLLTSNMSKNKIPTSLIITIPLQAEPITAVAIRQILLYAQLNFRAAADKKQNILLGNNKAGLLAYNLMPECRNRFNACLLFDAYLPIDAASISTLSYYLDITDEGINYKAYHSFYMSLRHNNVNHEYRVRQGTPSFDSFLIGLDESSNYMKIHLKP